MFLPMIKKLQLVLSIFVPCCAIVCIMLPFGTFRTPATRKPVRRNPVARGVEYVEHFAHEHLIAKPDANVVIINTYHIDREHAENFWITCEMCIQCQMTIKSGESLVTQPKASESNPNSKFNICPAIWIIRSFMEALRSWREEAVGQFELMYVSELIEVREGLVTTYSRKFTTNYQKFSDPLRLPKLEKPAGLDVLDGEVPFDVADVVDLTPEELQKEGWIWIVTDKRFKSHNYRRLVGTVRPGGTDSWNGTETMRVAPLEKGYNTKLAIETMEGLGSVEIQLCKCLQKQWRILGPKTADKVLEKCKQSVITNWPDLLTNGRLDICSAPWDPKDIRGFSHILSQIHFKRV